MSAAARPAHPARAGALQSRDFRYFWLGLLLSHTGAWMQQVGQGWLVYQLTNTPIWLGLTQLAFAVPMVALPLVGGVVADRLPRVHLIRGLQLIMVAMTLAVAALIRIRVIEAWHLVLFSLVQGVFLAFENPARHAVVPDLVRRDQLMSALSLFQMSYQVGGFVGPSVAGLILGALGSDRIDLLFAINALTYLAFAVALSLIGNPAGPSRPAARVDTAVTDGVRFVLRQPALRALLTLIAVVGVFGRSYVALLPVFARDVLRLDARGLSFLTASPGVGVILGSIALSALRVSRSGGRVIIVCAALFALILTGFALSTTIGLSVALLLTLGIVSVTLTAAMASSMQLATTNELRGRVMSLWSIANIGLPSFGSMLTAGAAAAVGAPVAVAAGAAIVLVGVAVVGRWVLLLDG
jgi:MFS family permease